MILLFYKNPKLCFGNSAVIRNLNISHVFQRINRIATTILLIKLYDNVLRRALPYGALRSIQYVAILPVYTR